MPDKTKFMTIFSSKISCEEAMDWQFLPVSDSIVSPFWYGIWNKVLSAVKHNLIQNNLELNLSFVQIIFLQ